MFSRRTWMMTAALCAASVTTLFGQTSVNAMVRVVHASPDAPAVDVVVAGGPTLFNNISYLGFTDYISVPPGSYTINVNVAGTTTTAFSKPFTLPAGAFLTVFAVGNIKQSLTSQPFDLVAAVDDRTVPTAGSVRVRVLHGAPAVPAVDGYVVAPYTPLTSISPAAGASFKGITPFLTIPNRLYQLRLTLSGQKAVAAQTGSLRLADRWSYTIIALNPRTADGPVEFLTIGEPPAAQ